MVIATVDTHIPPNGNDLWDTLLTGVTATAVSGFVLAVCMMFSFRQMVDAQLTAYRKTNKGVKTDAGEEEAIVESLHKEREAHPGGNGWNLISAIAHDHLGEAATKMRDKSMPLKDAQRILLRGRMFNVLGVFLWQTKAMCVMLVGVGVKLSMYEPMADPHAFFASQQVC